MDFKGYKFKYENGKLYKLNKKGGRCGKPNEWGNLSNNKPDRTGYIRICLVLDGKRKKYALSRLVFKLHNPTWDIDNYTPNNYIDHIDRNPINNTIENLRCVNVAQNGWNRSDNIKGYQYDKRNKYRPYVAQIFINGKKKCLGCYETAEEAHNVYLQAKQVYTG